MKNRKAEPGLRLINMEDVAVEQVEWLLYPFIPYGKVTIIQGDPGEGKTTMVLQIIAKLTKGEPVLPVMYGEEEPIEKAGEPVNVIYQTAEDGLGDTIKPRLLAAGADCSKVLVIDDSEQPLTMLDEEFLLEILADGAVEQNLIIKESESRSIKRKTLWNAKKALGVQSKKTGDHWSWVLPEQ